MMCLSICMCISILVNTTCDPLLPAFLCSRRYLPDLAVVNINEQLRFPRQKRLQFQVMARLIRLADKGHGSYVSFFLTNVILGEHDLQNAPGSVCVCVQLLEGDYSIHLFHLNSSYVLWIGNGYFAVDRGGARAKDH